MNKTTPPMTSSRPFQLEFEYALEGVDNVWQAHAMLVSEATLECAEVHNVEYIGDSPNAWPMLKITFASIECAKAYTAIYLGIGPIQGAWDVYMDDEVNEYISSGRFVD